MITVSSHNQALSTVQDPLAAYQALRTRFAEEQLFLLESLAGPAADCNKSVVGFNPLLTLTVTRQVIQVAGQEALCKKVSAVLQSSPLLSVLAEGRFQLQAPKNLWDVLRLVEALFQIDYQGTACPLRFGFFGYFGYDVARYIERLPELIPWDSQAPEIALSLYQGLIYNDLNAQKSFLVLNESVDFQGVSVAEIQQCLNQPRPQTPTKIPEASLPIMVSDSMQKVAFLEAVEKSLGYIAIGDIYQIQIGHELTIASKMQPFEVYQRLRALNPSPYMYLTKIAGLTIVGASPELCVRLVEDNITVRPIAGTIKRGKTASEDAELAAQLLQDEKERAEHLMLVDLARNDIGCVCEPNSLKVTELMVIETYSHVLHMVSNVIGKKAKVADQYDVLMANLPAGTVSGTPKVRAMELIESLENKRRGLYAGCLGFIDFQGNIETALCIRTATYQDGRYYIRASAGIVADSKPESEWLESIGKLSSTYLAITGRELRNEAFIN